MQIRVASFRSSLSLLPLGSIELYLWTGSASPSLLRILSLKTWIDVERLLLTSDLLGGVNCLSFTDEVYTNFKKASPLLLPTNV